MREWVLLVLFLAWWLTVGYVIIHFIVKYW
jgi:hypothetical protein